MATLRHELFTHYFPAVDSEGREQKEKNIMVKQSPSSYSIELTPTTAKIIELPQHWEPATQVDEVRRPADGSEVPRQAIECGSVVA